MKITIEVWQNAINDEWNCDITTSSGSQYETEHWAVESFCELLNLIDKKFPNVKCFAKENDS